MGHFRAMKKCNKNIICKKKGDNCSVPVSLCFKNKLELEKQAMLQKNALRLHLEILCIFHYPSQIYHLMGYTLQPHQKDYKTNFYTFQKKICRLSEVNSLILRCKDKMVFKTTPTGKSLAQEGDTLREKMGKHFYLLVYASLRFNNRGFGFDARAD